MEYTNTSSSSTTTPVSPNLVSSNRSQFGIQQLLGLDESNNGIRDNYYFNNSNGMFSGSGVAVGPGPGIFPNSNIITTSPCDHHGKILFYICQFYRV